MSEHATLARGVSLADDVVVGPGARLLADARVDRAARIGANATVGSGVSIGRGAVVEGGAVVVDHVPPYSVVLGNPARIVDYVDAAAPTESEQHTPDDIGAGASVPTGVHGVVLYGFTRARDLRGSLAAVEFAELPFTPQRTFVVHGVPNESVRGAHAHRECAQMLVCVNGEVSCVVDDGRNRRTFRLTRPEVGLYVPPLVWSMQYRYSSDAVLLVLAALPYDPDDYVRDYDGFLELVSRG